MLGDYNDVDDSPTLEVIEKGAGLVNSSQDLPASWGISKPHDTFPPSRLDHILVDRILATKLFNRGVLVHPEEAQASDHRLVYADFRLAS